MSERMGTDDWCTPKWIADLVGSFDLDPCSNTRSHIIAGATCSLDHADEERRDGLACDWSDSSVWCNPPYSGVMPWARKLTEHAGPWCALLKLDPTTKWWVELMRSMPTVAPLRKRVRFEGAPGEPTMTANFPSVLVYSAWRPSRELAAHLWLPTYARAA